ncbi:MAG: type II secretion system protein N [Steroidobacteraceae bacterium]
MLDSPVGKLLERVPRNGPWLVSLALAALIGVELARAASALFLAQPTSPRLEPPRPSQVPRRERVDVNHIATAHPFGTFVVDPSPQDPKPTTAKLVLAGTIATEDPRHGIAIIDDESRSRVYAVGQNVGGALLHAVYLDHVLLDRNGALETLVLPKLLAGAKQPASRSRSSQEATLAAQNAPTQDAQPEVDDVVQLAPSRIRGMQGFRVVGGKDLEAFRAAGLRPLDLVTAINGAPLQDQNSAQRSINELQSTGHATVTVMRGGQAVDVSVNLDQ